MINYISEKQLSISEFKTPFKTGLLTDNSWVKLASIVPGRLLLICIPVLYACDILLFSNVIHTL